MKKTLLLATLVASVASFSAGTKGSVEAYNENTYDVSKHSINVDKVGVKTDVSVKGTGLSFGGKLEAKNLPSKSTTLTKSLLSNSELFLQYKLPEIYNVNSSVKATIKATNIKLEANANYKVDEALNVALHSDTTFNYASSNNYAETVISNQKLTVDAFKGVKGNTLKDVQAYVGFKHSYAGNAFKRVTLGAKATYGVANVDLNGKYDFEYLVNDTIAATPGYKLLLAKKSEVDLEKLALNNGSYHHALEVTSSYKALENKLSLNGGLFIEHVHVASNNDVVNYGLGVKGSYKVLENLSVNGGLVSGGNSTLATAKTHKGLGALKLGAKYDYNVTNKFIVSPEFEASAFVYGNKSEVATGLELTPKLSAKYKPVNNLTLTGSVSTPVKFGGTNKAFDYKNTELKSSLNVKYTWE